MAPSDSMTLNNIHLDAKSSETIRFLYLKNIDLDTKMIILSALVQKLWSKTSFCIMLANVTRSGMSHIQTAQNVF